MACPYQVISLEPSLDCRETCGDCSFTHTVSGRSAGDDCLYAWTVTRTCGSGTPQTWQGHEAVACGTTKSMTFYCDDNEQCPRLRIVLTPGPCPGDPPQGS